MSRPMPLPPLPDTPRVSVLVASYNYASYLPEALGSVLGESYPELEVIVCDDGSTDASVEVARQVAAHDSRVRVIEKTNGGVASALNAAFKASAGQLVCLLDADDAFVPGKVGRIVDLARSRPAAGLFVHGMLVVDARGQVLRTIDPGGTASNGWIAADVQRRGGRWRSAPASGMVLRREVAGVLFPLPEPELRSVADGYLLTLAPLLTEVAAVPDVLSIYRLHGANLTGVTGFSAEASARQLEGMLRINRLANAWLEQNRPAIGPLDAGVHLNVIEHRRWRKLLGEGDAVSGIGYARAVYRDDLYGGGRKVAGLLAGLGAIVIPKPWRASWLGWVLGRRPMRPVTSPTAARPHPVPIT